MPKSNRYGEVASEPSEVEEFNRILGKLLVDLYGHVLSRPNPSDDDPLLEKVEDLVETYREMVGDRQ